MRDDFIQSQVNGWTPDRVEQYYKAINQRIARELQEPPIEPPLTPASNQMSEFLLSLGYGDKPYEGIATGIKEFDNLIGGLNKFVLLAARAGVGKSTLAIQIALGALQHSEVPILFYSFEMSRHDIFAMMMQNLTRTMDYHLTRKEIVLHGNKPINSNSGNAISEAATMLQDLSPDLYVIDATDGDPTTSRIETDIDRIKEQTGKEDVLVVIDSLQDLVEVGSAGATSAEAVLAQHIVEIQQSTKATFLAISQKAKGGTFDDPYAGVLGSVSLIHKPTAVVELLSVYDLIRQVKDRELVKTYTRLADTSDIANPVIARVIKGRNNGHGHVALMHYGPHGYFEVGRVPDFDVNTETSLYDLIGID